ncbi:hypothetical protein [Thalassobacillus devorans]|uniref:hypothetical protein n=1 Tax=Thalassobacillus devorans TaxID=279813 RepID=UPI00111C2EDD|nr:hypothetical protein [Thalassobacillus devorans]
MGKRTHVRDKAVFDHHWLRTFLQVALPLAEGMNIDDFRYSHKRKEGREIARLRWEDSTW